MRKIEQDQIKGLEQRLEVIESFRGGGFSSIWGESNSGLDPNSVGGLNFSYGHGASNNLGIKIGYKGKIRYASANLSAGVSGLTEIAVCRNGSPTSAVLSWNSGNQPVVENLDIDVYPGDIIGFKTLTGTFSGSVGVSCSIETLSTAGQSAYETAVEQGFTGTKSQWLDSLKGQDSIVGLDIRQYGAVGDGIFHTVEEWLIGGTLDKGYANLAEIQADYPFVDSLSKNVNWAAFQYVKGMYPNMQEELTLYFPRGTYVFDKQGPLDLQRSNIRLYGDGYRETHVICISPDNSDGLKLNSTGKGSGQYYLSDRIDMYDLSEDTLGKSYLTLLDSTKASEYYPGQLVMIRYGASYFAQDYGEFNKVRKIEGNKIYFEKLVARNYLPDTSPYHPTAALVNDLHVIPGVNSTFTAEITNGPPAHEYSVTIDKYNFEIIEKNGNIYTLRNGWNIPEMTIPAPSKLYKCYGICRMYEDTGGSQGTGLQIVENIIIEGMSFSGSHNALVADNVYNVTLKDCHFYRDVNLGNTPTGLVWQMDFSRDIKVLNCKFEDADYKGSQISRSTGDVVFYNCEFVQCSPLFTEFNFDCSVINCHIEIKLDPDETNALVAGVGVGGSCNNMLVIGNKMKLHNVAKGIGSEDIQTYPQNTNNGNVYSDNMIIMTGEGSGFSSIGGQTLIANNYFWIENGSCFSITKRVAASSRFDGMVTIQGNTFIGGLTNLCFIKDDFIIKDNVFRRLSILDNDIPFGNIINNHGNSTQGHPKNVKITGNTFYNWFLQDYSVNFIGTPRPENDLSNNRFINCLNKTPKDFTIDFIELIYPNINSSAKTVTPIPSVEINHWEGMVNLEGGTLTNSDKFIAKTAIRSIYENNLRDKIIRLNLFIGDAKASLVPLLGYGMSNIIPRRFPDIMENGMTEADFDPTLGWVSDGTKTLYLLDSRFINYGSFGFTMQFTGGFLENSQIAMGMGSSTPNIYIGRVSTSNIGTINRQIGGSVIYDKGFISSSNKASVLNTDLIDNGVVNSYTSSVTKNYHEQSFDGQRSPIKLFKPTSQPGLSGSVGGYAITSYLTETEALLLRDIFKNAMISLGRPVQ